MWLKVFFTQFSVFQPSSSIYVDNQSCMKIAKNLIYHMFAQNILKCINVTKITSRKTKLNYTATNDQIIDILTKTLSQNNF
jgi:regulator of PEP synthase PpsR (kinase-PPPase family)